MRNESATVPTAMPPISFSEKRNQRPKMPLTAAPASGSRGTSQMYLYISLECGVRGLELKKDSRLQTPDSPLHQINLINPDRFAIAIERDHYAESNRCFGSRDDNHEHGEDLSCKPVAVSGV